MKGRVLLILSAFVFAVIFRSGNFPIKVATCLVAFVLLVAYLGWDILILVKSKGHDIRLSEWELDAKRGYSYRTVITLYVVGIFMLGACVIVGLRSLDNFITQGTLSQRQALVAAFGLVLGLASVLAIIQAGHIKYILYMRKDNSTTEK